MTVIIVVIAIIVLLALWVLGIYNRLVRLKNQVSNAWSQIDVQLQRRYDLIPNLVETVKGYMTYERQTLEAVITARNRASSAREDIVKSGGVPDAQSMKELMGAETQLKGAVGSIFALAESYPQLRASENMQQLQEELTTTENKVAFSRQAYNDSAMLYNTAQQEFPAVMFASAFGHKPAELYAIEQAEAKQAVKVKF